MSSQYLRKLAAIFNTKDPLKFGTEIQRLEGLFNSSFSVRNKEKKELFQNPNLDQIEIDHIMVSDPRFQFVPKASRIQFIKEQKEMRGALKQIKEIRDYVELGKEDPKSFQTLMSDSDNLLKILELTQKSDITRINNDGTFDKVKKLQ